MNSRRKKAGLIALAVVAIASVTVSFTGCSAGITSGLIGSSGPDFLSTGRTLSFFQAFQVDPRSEDTAGPQFVVGEDLNGDGLMDLVSAWNQSQPVQIHLQRRSTTGQISFETVTLAGSTPVVSVAGLAVADFDADGRMDVAVMVKQSLLEGPECLDAELPTGGLSGIIVVYLGPADAEATNQALAWQEVPVGTSFLQGTGMVTSAPGEGGFTDMTVGDMDLDGDLDIVVAWNSDCQGGTNDVVVFSNGGPGNVRDGTWTASRIPDGFPKGATIKSLALGDIDRDGDLDIAVTYPAAQAMNVRWYRNPAIDVPDDVHISDSSWQTGTIGQIATGVDTVRMADLDRDGIVDAVVLSSGGAVLQWFKGPTQPTTAPLRAIPWQVFTLAEYRSRIPNTIGLGDLTGNGRIEVLAAAEGGLSWFDSQAAPSVFDQWIEHLIVDDASDGSSNVNAATTDPNVIPSEIPGASLINAITVVDLDGDGSNDLVVTLDRSGLSGLTNDALVWFRNIR